ncbi:uncharacterized protein PpBr36_06682 [Pyricularia pennisetigena]|uniref:uncharacterized protein n=1 Tax=Pyricularia pennisetigena TaxID=1578925 RepID=UPI00115231D0|nr:uncharacterized protein PpBr36_06682 [Pyricularia pennisetigena]TLS23477.1 hypothetical protein PpBr36_06682 [Pyricularia pennisetigena]
MRQDNISAAAPQKLRKDVPPPTPVNLPNYVPRFAARQGGGIDQADDNEGHIDLLKVPLVKLLRTIIRPVDVSEKHFQALGVNVVPNVAIQELIPDTSVLPDFAAWEAMDHARACDINQSTRVRICNGNMSPGVEIYQDRIRELSTPNEAAYRSVRRMKPVPGQVQARLGNSYEFFRNLEVVSTYWEDTSAVLAGKVANPTAATTGEAAGQGTVQAGDNGQAKAAEEVIFYRTGSGAQMPPEYRINVTNSFLKLVAYDFGCNVTGPRTEPRLYLNTPSVLAPIPDTAGDPKSTSVQDVPALPQSVPSPGPSSYFSSDCTFIFRTPRTREAARQGLCEGPVAAVSARHTTTFPPSDPTDSTLSAHPDSVVDLAREIVAALVTAQHRAREGRIERRIGKDAWWATKKRWGGGTGGTIGRESELSSAMSTSTGSVEGGDRRSSGSSKERSRPSASLVEPTKSSVTGEEPARLGSDLNSEAGPNRKIGGPVIRASSPSSSHSPSAIGRKSIQNHQTPHLTPRVRTKSRRTTLAIYDSYRMVRPPAAAWDPKTRYSPIGRIPGADFDDIFVVSALFHHISFLRVRVPTRLLEVLDGAPDNIDEGSTGGHKTRSWGGLDVYRTQWYDLFLADDRVAAMKVVWAMLAYLMRATDDDSGGDVKMAGT